jgi:prepilin peptidase CpaA
MVGGLSDAIVFATLCAGVGTAAVIDIKHRRIPNVVCATTAIAGIAFAATGVSQISVASSAIGLVLGLVLMLPGHVFGATGAGDVKLFGATGAVLGAGRVLPAFLFMAIAGGVLAVFIAWQRGRLRQTVRQTAQLCGGTADAKAAIESPRAHNRFPYGPAIAVGSVLAALMS